MDQIRKYFRAERAESLLFLLVGVVTVGSAVRWGFSSGTGPFFRGMAWPLGLVGVIQLVVGSTIFFRTPSDIRRMERYLASDPGKVQTEEIPRMEKVMQNFVSYRWTEITLMAAGVL